MNNAENALAVNNRKTAIPWVIETPGGFLRRKKRLKISAEEVAVIDGAALIITINASKGHYMGISQGNWVRFYPLEVKKLTFRLRN
jgi:hypothetical protein